MKSQPKQLLDGVSSTNHGAGGHDDNLPLDSRNGRGPIFKLPAEVLLEIFLVLRDSCAVGDWLPISHVCQAWREVALGAAALWNEPPTNFHDMTLLMLERSRMVDLNVYVTNETSAATVTALMGQIHRIRLLSLIQEPQLLRTSCDILRTSVHQALRLENILIDSPVNQPEPLLVSSAISFDHLPRLRHVTFGHIRFKWTALPLSKLSSINLVNAVPHRRVSTKQFLEILAQMTHLERIIVTTWSAFPQYHDNPPPDVGLKVKMPKLSYILFVLLDPRQLEFLFSVITMPQLRSMNIAIQNTDFDWTSLFGTISSAVLKGAFGEFTTVMIGGCLVRLSNPAQTLDAEEPPPTSLVIGSPTNPGMNLDYFAARGVSGLDPRIFSTVVNLAFIHDHIPSEYLLQTCFSHLQGLLYLTLPITRVRNLADIQHNDSLDPPTVIPFPNLVSIVVTGNNQPEDEAAWADVVHCVRVRKSYGLQPLLLELTNSAPRPNSTVEEALRELDVDVMCFRR